ncbi:4'-phosphopantetheinyl transferase superfamily protein [Tissierella sp.]|uniref:4'-phosphopantetheinyl transferase family protein n=1 Tax=Tissierella sp. TaxID=41274 RepID=UPI00306C179B
MYIYITNIENTISYEHFKYLLSIVSHKTKERIIQFRFLEDAKRTLFGEVMLRAIVIKHYGTSNDQIEIATGPYGKPYIKNLPIQFNISHSGKWVMCAVSNNTVGADIEQIKKIDISQIIHYFNQKEYEYILSQVPELRLETFYKIWTLKESYIKWLGAGLSISLKSFYFSFDNLKITINDDAARSKKPYFMQYLIDGHIISICCSVDNFPFNITEVNINEIQISR